MKRAIVIAALLASARAVADPPPCRVAGGVYATLSYWEGAFRTRSPVAETNAMGQFVFVQSSSIDEAHMERLEIGGALRLCSHDAPGIAVRLGVEDDSIGFNIDRAFHGFGVEVNAPLAPQWRLGGRLAYLSFGLPSGAAPDVVAGVRARNGFLVFDLDVLHESAPKGYIPPGIDESTWGFFLGVGIDAISIGEQ